ncbi:MAG: bifunctional phosphoribosyl-AMP cyclohydrolase/phosphoribosyl-ATP diphosphatase HisIE [Saprospiraceae bacterium]|nr:bifunctional phosphoribosyl-AMP cyclohydrolase/phosphoribosyl-ATP diphosphatase HisIE [Saprospiraceae bacterium]
MIDISSIDFAKTNGLVPAIIQDDETGKVLMLGYMNEEAVKQTIDSQKVTFFSRSKERLWMKGEESGNVLGLVDMKLDCDRDTLLVTAVPSGPVCHKGSDTCWGEKNTKSSIDFLNVLEGVIDSRRKEGSDQSYTSSLFNKGINKIAQKVGEEAVELVIESKDENDDLFLNEAADLVFHLLVLLKAKNKSLAEVVKILEGRHKPA